MSLVGQTIGNYHVGRLIGEGGMGAVYAAEHVHLKRRVALKTLLPSIASSEVMVSRFFAEARAASAIGHPGIVQVIDLGRAESASGSIAYYAMELLEGETLRAAMERGIPFDQSAAIVRACADALAASHRAGVVHRDLKPENIFLVSKAGAAPQVKLLDFGVARLLANGAVSAPFRTRAGMLLGTPAYMSPEQAGSGEEVDGRSDVYALGVLFYQLLCGRLPFEFADLEELLRAQRQRAPQPPWAHHAGVPEALGAIALHAMQKEPQRRFQTMDELVAALDHPDEHLLAWRSESRDAAWSAQRSPAEEAAVQSLSTLAARVGPTAQPHAHPSPASMAATPIATRPEPASPRRGPREIEPESVSALSIVRDPGSPPRSPPRGAPSVDRTSRPSSPSGSSTPARRLFLVAGAVLAVGAGAAIATLLAGGGTTDPVAYVELDSRPSGATVHRSGRPDALGVTPLRIPVRDGEPRFDVKLELAGHRYEVVEIDPGHAAPLTIDLQPAAR